MASADLIRRRFRVGLVVLVGLIAGAIGVFMVGSRSNIFTRKVDYVIHFSSASGLTTGNAVHLAGVTVGNVTEVRLSPKPGDSTVTVVISVDRRMTSRIRTDTRAAIRTIGLLGDKYIELEGGTAAAEEIPPGGDVQPAKEGGLEQLLEGSEGLLGDLSGIARSLRVVLERTEKGEGFLGEITSDRRGGRQLSENLSLVLAELGGTLHKINSGKSLAGQLLADEAYGKKNAAALSSAIDSAATLFSRLSNSVNDHNSAIGALLNDPDGRQKVFRLLDNFSQAGVSLATASKDLESGRGVLPLLLHDEKFGTEFRDRLASFIAHADSISAKLDRGDGSLGKLVNDPSLYDAANDIVIGVNESRILKSLIRGRQKSGIEKRSRPEKPDKSSATGPSGP